MSNVGKYINIHPSVTNLKVYKRGGYPYLSPIATLNCKEWNGLSYRIVSDSTGNSNIYTVESPTYGVVDILVHSGEYSITTDGAYLFNGTSSNTALGKYLNLHPHVNSWNLYPVGVAPISSNKKAAVSPKEMNGLSYLITGVSTIYESVYTIKSSTYGYCDIYAPRDQDSSISPTGIYLDTKPIGGGSSTDGYVVKYLNLHPIATKWNLYPIDKAPISGNEIVTINPSSWDGLSYPILATTAYQNVYTIQSATYGVVNIYADAANDPECDISSEGMYLYTTPNSGYAAKYLNLSPKATRWNLYPTSKTPTVGNEIATINPSEWDGLSYPIVSENTGYANVYTIESITYGRVNIYADPANDPECFISPNGVYLYTIPESGHAGKYLNLCPEAIRWNLYPTDKTPTVGNEIVTINPSEWNGLSYPIVSENTGYANVYTIQSITYGRVNIYADPANDPECFISSEGVYLYTTPGSGSGGSVGDIGLGNDTVSILPRSAWGARAIMPEGMDGNLTQVNKIIIHHTAGYQLGADIDEMKEIQRQHMYDQKDEDNNWVKWEDIGYHYCIGRDGTVMQGRESKYVGAHTIGANRDSIGVSLFGNFETYTPTQKQIDNLIPLLVLLCKEYGLNTNNIFGHRDYWPTACPGRELYSLLPQIKQKVRKRSSDQGQIEDKPENDEILSNESFLKDIVNQLDIFKAVGIEFAVPARKDDVYKDGKLLNKKSPQYIISRNPVITTQGEVSFTTIIGNDKVLNINSDSKSTASKFKAGLAEINVTNNLSESDITKIFESIGVVIPAGENMLVKSEIDNLINLKITGELKIPVKFSNISLNLYVRTVLIIYNAFPKGQPTTIPVPIQVYDLNYDPSNNKYVVRGVVIVAILLLFGGLIAPAVIGGAVGLVFNPGNFNLVPS